MNPEDQQELTKIRRRAIWYNQAVNFFWSILNFVPVGYYCSIEMNVQWFYSFLIISLLAMFLPNSFFDSIQLSHTTATYTKIGIRTIKKYTQDGDMINGFLRKKFPQYKLVTTSSPLKKHIGKAYVNEKFHFIVFVFFLFTTLYALMRGHGWWVFVIMITNLIYNVYPIFLQQYNRIRIRQLMQKKSGN